MSTTTTHPTASNTTPSNNNNSTASQTTEVTRILSLPTQSSSAAVLQLTSAQCRDSTREARKARVGAYRIKSLLIHPDRCGDGRATEAFVVLRRAFEGCAGGNNLSDEEVGGEVVDTTHERERENAAANAAANASKLYDKFFGPSSKSNARAERLAKKSRRAETGLDGACQAAAHQSWTRETGFFNASGGPAEPAEPTFQRSTSFGRSDTSLDEFIGAAHRVLDEDDEIGTSGGKEWKTVFEELRAEREVLREEKERDRSVRHAARRERHKKRRPKTTTSTGEGSNPVPLPAKMGRENPDEISTRDKSPSEASQEIIPTDSEKKAKPKKKKKHGSSLDDRANGRGSLPSLLNLHLGC
ncbi:hypothetical protein DFS34DRAFT_435752 [Phlyctochytrium arcticum]|nr:hypothetical protein DFS34DRAFT_435752 [Phlyctochytrium arcticum]